MPSENNVTPPSDSPPPASPHVAVPLLPAAGLPPVSPPSGKLMLQLFLIPGLIVAFLVGAWLFAGWLFGTAYTAKAFLEKLDDSNVEVRWRAAADLAQVLQRDEHLSSDEEFARQLALRLEAARQAAAPAEKSRVEHLDSVGKDEAKAERLKLETDYRNYIAYLAACLGEFSVPVGAPVLKDLALQHDGLDPKALAAQRRRAVWGLANLGENLKRFDKLPADQKDALLARLRLAVWALAHPDEGKEDREEFEKLSAEEKDTRIDALKPAAEPPHADWMRDALHCLRGRAAGQDDPIGVDRALVDAADAEDPFLRELAALAMNFWRGDAEADARMEKALVKLSYDDGRGEDSLGQLSDEEDPGETRAVSHKAGQRVCFNAVVALARRGSPKIADRMDVLAAMLDGDALRKNFVLVHKNGTEEPEKAAVDQTLFDALKAVAELHRLRPEMDLSALNPAIDALATTNGNPALRSEAQNTQIALKSPQ
jgi:hypothetical protein